MAWILSTRHHVCSLTCWFHTRTVPQKLSYSCQTVIFWRRHLPCLVFFSEKLKHHISFSNTNFFDVMWTFMLHYCFSKHSLFGFYISIWSFYDLGALFGSLRHQCIHLACIGLCVTAFVSVSGCEVLGEFHCPLVERRHRNKQFYIITSAMLCPPEMQSSHSPRVPE